MYEHIKVRGYKVGSPEKEEFLPFVVIDKTQIGQSNSNEKWKYEGFRITTSCKKYSEDKYFEKNINIGKYKWKI